MQPKALSLEPVLVFTWFALLFVLPGLLIFVSLKFRPAYRAAIVTIIGMATGWFCLTLGEAVGLSKAWYHWRSEYQDPLVRWRNDVKELVEEHRKERLFELATAFAKENPSEYGYEPLFKKGRFRTFVEELDRPGKVLKPLFAAHAHNDYEHSHPFWDAFNLGFCNIEPDIFLVDGKLLVAHNLKDVTVERSLEALYLDPILKLVESGEISKERFPITLLIDVKSAAVPTYEVLHRTLERYEKMLTRFEGDRVFTNAVTVVVSGERTREVMQQQNRRFATYDGRLEDIDSPAPSSFIWWISDDWTQHFQWRGEGPLSDSDLAKLKAIVAKVHARGSKLRFWAMPDKPEVWQMLKTNQVDIIGSDNLKGLRDFLIGK